jgi:hypothetical protein
MTSPRPPVWLSVAVSAWGLGYAVYRGYYALGGTRFLPGEVADPDLFRRINSAAAVILILAAALPLVALPLWQNRYARPILLTLFWIIAVGCSVHALVDSIERVLSLTGHLRIEYPASVWASVDHRTADLQDLLFNEPWFLLEGLGFAALAWTVLGLGTARRRWVVSAVAATVALTIVGLLSATGAIGKFIIF